MKAIKEKFFKFLSKRKMTNSSEEDAKKYCLNLLINHLNDGWKDAKLANIEFRRIFGGSTAFLCYVKSLNCQPEEVIVRFHYANVDEENYYDLKFIGEAGETLVFHILSELSFGPKLYSVFNGGRIEEFIPSIQLADDDIINGVYHKEIIKKISYIHTLEIPILKDENWILRFYNNYEQVFKDLEFKKQKIIDNNRDFKHLLIEIFNFNLIKELFWFKECLPKLNCRLVFSHNDITKRNILIKKNYNSLEDRCVLIDFGDCGYNCRGLDLADYFRCIVSIVKVMRDNEEIKFYSDNEIKQFCIWYLEEFKKQSTNYDPKIDNLDQLLKEVYYFLLLSDLMTILYITLSTRKSKSNSKSNKINWSYCIKRIALYKDSKRIFFDKYGDQIDFKETL